MLEQVGTWLSNAEELVDRLVALFGFASGFLVCTSAAGMRRLVVIGLMGVLVPLHHVRDKLDRGRRRRRVSAGGMCACVCVV